MSALFQPLRLGRIEINNRFIRSATYYGLADEEGRIGDPSVELMKRLADSGVGLIITGYAFVARSGQVFSDMNGIDSDTQIPGYQRMTRAVHARSGKIVMQIAHGGEGSAAAVRKGGHRLVVSIGNGLRSLWRRSKELTEEDIHTLIDAFGQAARRVQEAGFDGVQIHGAHGYLISQFLSPRTNRRKDRWGGSFENRKRFVIEVVRAIKQRVDKDFPVMTKLGCRDYLDEDCGLTIEEGSAVAASLEREGVCFIEVSHGITGTPLKRMAHKKKNARFQEAYLLPDAEVIRRSTSVPLAVVGGMRSLPIMQAAIDSGAVDCISLCRPLIREPDLIKRWTEGDTRPATCCSCAACLKPDENFFCEIRCRQPSPGMSEQSGL